MLAGEWCDHSPSRIPTMQRKVFMVATDTSAQPLALQSEVDSLRNEVESLQAEVNELRSDRDYYKEQFSKLSSENYDLRTTIKVLMRNSF